MPRAGLTSNAAIGTPAAPATADTSGSKLAGLAKLKTAGKKVVLTTKLTGHEDHDDFEQYGSLAGPPGRPVATDVEAATCVLRWEPPRHTGGRGIAVVGYHITVQFAGDGGFFVHTPDTGSFDPNMLLQGLRPDTWHEFQVAAITAGGVGAPSLPSRPAQTPRAPQLHRDLEAAKLALQKTRTKLTEKRDALMRMGAGGAGMAPTGGMGIYGPGASGGAAPGGALLDGAAKGSHRHKKAAQREIDALQQKAAVQLRRLDALQSQRAAELRQQRLRMLEAAGAELPPELKAMQEQREKAKRAKEQSVDGQIDALVATAAKGDAPASAAASASASASAAPPAPPAPSIASLAAPHLDSDLVELALLRLPMPVLCLARQVSAPWAAGVGQLQRNPVWQVRHVSVRALIEGGASDAAIGKRVRACRHDLDLLDDDGNTPLHIAVRHAKTARDLKAGDARAERIGPELLHAMAAASADTAALVSEYQRGEVPLHLALRIGVARAKVLALLHAAPRAASSLDYRGRSPLHIAASQGAPAAVVQALLTYRPHAAVTCDDEGRSPLDLALKRKHINPQVVSLLERQRDAVFVALEADELHWAWGGSDGDTDEGDVDGGDLALW